MANESTAQYTPVIGSNSPRVVGESYTGGRIAKRVRSPMSSVSPSMIQRQRGSGKSKQFVCRSIIAQLHTSCAFGHALKVSSRFPVWSTSSCDKKIHRTFFGSTSENTSFNHCSRFAIVPVSTIIGSAPRITNEFKYTNNGWPSAGWTEWISQVSSAIWSGGTYVVGAIGVNVMARPPCMSGAFDAEAAAIMIRRSGHRNQSATPRR